MMGIGTSDAKALTLWEYSALLWNWNDAHATDQDPVGLPDKDLWKKMQERARVAKESASVH